MSDQLHPATRPISLKQVDVVDLNVNPAFALVARAAAIRVPIPDGKGGTKDVEFFIGGRTDEDCSAAVNMIRGFEDTKLHSDSIRDVVVLTAASVKIDDEL